MNGNNLREHTDKSEKNIEGNCEQSKINEVCHPDLKKCEICCQQFESVLELKYHFEICKKGLECNHCQKNCESVELFKQHNDICDGVNKYRCFVCGKKFESESKCLMHIKKCVGKLPCKRCNKTCLNYKLLLEHNKRFHEPIKCDICKKVFYVKSHLLDHIEKHEEKL